MSCAFIFGMVVAFLVVGVFVIGMAVGETL